MKNRRIKYQLYVDGYRFVIASQSETTIYLKCANFRNKCNARASKRKDSGQTYITKSAHAPSCIFSESALSDSTVIDSDSEHIKNKDKDPLY